MMPSTTRASSAPDSGVAFYDRSVRASCVMGALAALLTAVYAGPANAVAYGLPLVWMLINFRVLRVSLREILRPRRRLWAMALIVLANTGWIALCVLLAFVTGALHNSHRGLAFLLGFNTPFLVMFLKAMGSVLTARPAAPRGSGHSGGDSKRTGGDGSLDR